MKFFEILQFFGTITPFFGFIYKIYRNFYRKNIEKAKDIIYEKLFFLISSSNEFDYIEILSIINSVLLQFKINKIKILYSELIQGFICKVICNPLLSSEKKYETNNKLKDILENILIAEHFKKLNTGKKKLSSKKKKKDTESNKYYNNDNKNIFDYEESKKKSIIYDIILISIFSILLMIFTFIIITVPDSRNDYLNWIIIFIMIVMIIFIVYDNIRKVRK